MAAKIVKKEVMNDEIKVNEKWKEEKKEEIWIFEIGCVLWKLVLVCCAL